MPSAGDVGAGMFDPFNQLPARLLAASADLEIARLWNAPVHTALLREAAEALEQRLGLLRDVERRLEEAAALISTPSQAHMQLTDPPPRSVLDIHLRAAGFTPDRDLCSAAWLILQALTTSKAKVAELELAARKRQATIDRQGQELGDLRKRREGPSHLPALLESLRLAGIEPNGTLLESCTLAVQALLAARAEVEDAQAKAAMFRRRTERLQAWFALPPDQRHPLGPEFTPDLEPEPSALAHAWAKLEANADGYLLCTHCRRERSAGRKAVQGCGDCRWLNNDEREDVAWRPDPGDDAGRREILAGKGSAGALLLSPSTGRFAIRDPETGEVVPVDPPVPVVVGEVENGPVTPGRVIHSGSELAAWLREDGGSDDPAQAVLGAGGLEVLPASDPAICKKLGLPDPRPALAIGHVTVVAHYGGLPMMKATLPAPRPGLVSTIGAHYGADVDVGIDGRYIAVYVDDGRLVAEVSEKGRRERVIPLHVGTEFDFGETVLTFLPDGLVPASLYRSGGTDSDDLLPLLEFRAELRRLRAEHDAIEAPKPRKLVACPSCDGLGSIDNIDPCFSCGGTGAIEEI